MSSSMFTIAGLARDYRSGATTPTTATAACLAAIDALDGTLGAWQTVYTDEAVAGAAAATAAIAAGIDSSAFGPFFGIPFALKDIIDLEGRVATAGSAAHRVRVSPATATIARRLLGAGGVLLGKTKTVEFALGGWGTNPLMGTPHNPWDPDTHRTPGGSSSGSGVAVASGMTPAAIGTDTGGSVRLPAAFCGIVGLKTTEGLLPTDGIVPLSHTLDTPGPMVTTVEDAAIMFDVLRGRSPLAVADDWQRGEGLFRGLHRGATGLRLGVMGERDRAIASVDVLAAYDRTLGIFTGLGAELVEFAPPTTFEEMRDASFVIVTAEAYAHHGELFGDPGSPLDPAVRARAVPGADHTAVDYVAAQLAMTSARRHFLEAWDAAGLDGYLLPSTPTTALPVEGIDEGSTPAQYTRAGNYLGLCGLALPMGLDPTGLPSGLQVLGRPFDEAGVLRIGAAFESARGPIGQPPIHASNVSPGSTT